MSNLTVKQKNQLGRNLIASSKIVQAYADTKVKDNSIQDVKDWMRKVIVILGLAETSIPEQQEYDFLAASIRSELGYFTLKEMEYAVILALHDKFTSAKKEDKISTDFYGKKFSLAWVIKLMKLYKDYRAKDTEFKQYLKAEFQLPEKSKQEQYNTLKSGLMELWERFKAGEDIRKELEWYYYSTLDEYCDLFNPSKEQKLLSMSNAEPLLEAQLKAQREKEVSLKGMIAASMPTIPNEEQLKNKAKELLMKEFFERLREMDMELELPERI